MKKSFPKKSLGQNFLTNPSVIKKIIDCCQLQPTDTVIEIGPGKGAITKLIAPKVKKLIAVETDLELTFQLKKELPFENTEIIHADFLKFSFENLNFKI